MQQKYIVENCKSFDPDQIFNCGQCFRWNKQQDNSYIGIFRNNVLKVKKENNKIIIYGICEKDIKEICDYYFDLNRDYEKIKFILTNIDSNMKESIKFGSGIRLLNQDLWETIISFIISANNNIPRIKKIIEKMSKKYGHEITFEKVKYYSFPNPSDLKNASLKDLRELGLGFRDKYVFETTKIINEGKINLEELSLYNTKELKKKLMNFKGVGPKVADCILLFSTLKRLEVFPVDVWVRRVMNDLYIHNKDEKKVNRKYIEELAKNKYGNLQGIAQQYLFYWKREKVSKL